jgi:hypothetical protein
MIRYPRIFPGLAVAAFLLVSLSGAVTVAAGPPYLLQPELNAGHTRLVRAALEVRGHLQMAGANGKTITRPLSVSGEVRYDEKLLSAAAEAGAGQRTVRHYDTVAANILIDGRRAPKRGLDEKHRLVVAVAGEDRTTLFAPRGHLTRDDLDLVALPADPLVLSGLLPEKGVGIGDQWEIPVAALAQIVAIDEIASSDAVCELKKVDGDVATVEVAGKVKGTVAGGGTEMDVAAKFTFDFRHRQISWLAISIKEKRAQTYIGPGLDTTARVIVEITPLAESPHLTDAALADLPLEPSPTRELLKHIAVAKEFQFELLHDRRWHVVTEDAKLVGLRLVDRSELVAQVNIAPMDRRAAGTSLALEEFQQHVQQALGKSFGQFLTIGQQANGRDYRVYRLEAIGKVNGLEILWIYYYVADREGRQLGIAFTLDSRLIDQFAKADLPLIERLILSDKPVAPAAESATRPRR